MEQTSKVLLDVEIKATEALKELAELKIKTDELRAEQKKLDTSTDEGKQKYAAYGEQIKALNAAAKERSKTIQNEIKTQNQQQNSLEQLKAKLSLLTQQYNSLSEADRKGAKGMQLAGAINEVTNELNSAEQGIQNYKRQVGGYQEATKGLRTEIKELTEALIRMKLAGEDSSAEYKTMADKLATMKDAMGDVNQETKGLGSDTKQFDTLSAAVTTASAAFAAYQSVAGLMANDDKEMAKTMQTLQIAMVALSAAITIQNNLQKQGLLYKAAENILVKVGINQTLRAAAAEAAYTKMKTAGTMGAKIAAAAQWLWNAALSANPVVLVALAVATLVAGIILLTKALASDTAEEKEAAAASAAFEKQTEKTAAAVAKRQREQLAATNERKNAWKDEELELRKNGATSEQIAKAKARAEQDLRDIEIKALNDISEARADELRASKRNYDAQVALLKQMKVGSKDYKEQADKVKELASAHNELSNTYAEGLQKTKELNQEGAEAQIEYLEKQREAYRKAALKALDDQKAIADERAAQNKINLDNEFFAQQEFSTKEFERLQAYEKEKLTMQKSFGQITAQEYAASMQLLSEKEKTFNLQRVDEIKKNYEEQIKAVKSMVKQSEVETLAATSEKYDKEIEELRKHYENLAAEAQKYESMQAAGIDLTTAEEERYKKLQTMLFENAAYQLQLEESKEQEKFEIQERFLSERIKAIDTASTEEYAMELAKFTDNELEKDRIAVEMAQKRLKELREMEAKETDPAKKLALQTEIAQAEGSLRASQAKQNLDLLNNDLLNTSLTEKQKYEIKKKYLEEQMALYEGNATKQAEISKDMVELEKQRANERVAAFSEYSGAAIQLLSSLNDVAKGMEERELQQYEQSNEQKKNSLKQRLDQGLISQEEYDKGVAAADNELDKKKKEIALKQAKREKALQIMSAIVNTATSIMSIWAQVPKFDFGVSTIALTAVAAAIGAAQVAAIAAQPLPTAAKGGLIGGHKHAAGGTLIEAEQGEAIINAKSMNNPVLRRFASLINEAGGGIPFVGGAITPASDGGYYSRNSAGSVSNNDLSKFSEQLGNTIASIKTYVTVEDIRRADLNYTEVEYINKN